MRYFLTVVVLAAGVVFALTFARCSTPTSKCWCGIEWCSYFVDGECRCGYCPWGDLVDCDKDPVSCGFCARDENCGGALPRCNVATGQCVPCLPQNDNCDGGLVCHRMDGGEYACESP